jgi:hypothetical protein
MMRLGVKVGQGCAALMDCKRRSLDCHRLEFDDIWEFICKKTCHVKEGDDPQLGDVWTYCPIDAETKLVLSYQVSSVRDLDNTVALSADLVEPAQRVTLKAN